MTIARHHVKRLSQSAEKFPRLNVCVTNTEQTDISIVMAI